MTLATLRIALLALAAAAALPVAHAEPIAFPTVAEALKSLEARDGNGTVVVHSEGWTIVNEPLASTQWSFTPAGYYAYPAVVRRVIKRDGKDVSVEVIALCEAGADACAKLKTEFEGMNERITQAVRAQGRQGSSQAPK